MYFPQRRKGVSLPREDAKPVRQKPLRLFCPRDRLGAFPVCVIVFASLQETLFLILTFGH